MNLANNLVALYNPQLLDHLGAEPDSQTVTPF
jgi:hypothetical protein